jgi:hypothetical protein
MQNINNKCKIPTTNEKSQQLTNNTINKRIIN